MSDEREKKNENKFKFQYYNRKQMCYRVGFFLILCPTLGQEKTV